MLYGQPKGEERARGGGERREPTLLKRVGYRRCACASLLAFSTDQATAADPTTAYAPYQRKSIVNEPFFLSLSLSLCLVRAFV